MPGEGAYDASVEVDRLKSLLDAFVDHLENSDLREQVRSLVPAVQSVRRLGINLMPEHAAVGAPERIISYLKRFPMTLVDGDELMVVAGIGEWARRVRELRVQSGWWIYSGLTIKEQLADNPEAVVDLIRSLGVTQAEIRSDQYVLVNETQDREAAHRWKILNTIRKKKGSAKSKLLEYLRANVGHAVSLEELRYLAKNASDWPRRIRELRTEEGWPIYTRAQGRPDLPLGSYVLEENKQAEAHDRNIPDGVRVEVLERDGFACVECGWSQSKLTPGDPRKALELHHVQQHKDKGANTPENLVTLCNVHHDDVHAGRLTVSAR